MKIIKSVQGKNVIVSDEDYDTLTKYKWYTTSRNYCLRYFKNSKNKLTSRSIHRDIMRPLKDEEIDHINRNPLDNRRDNLRIANRFENNHNVGIKTTNKTGYKGVHFDKGMNKYRAQITINKKNKYIGCFESAKEAAFAYNNEALKSYGEFANLNTI